jgi:hypothetical protein
MSKHLPAQEGRNRKRRRTFHAFKRGLFGGGIPVKILDMGETW